MNRLAIAGLSLVLACSLVAQGGDAGLKEGPGVAPGFAEGKPEPSLATERVAEVDVGEAPDESAGTGHGSRRSRSRSGRSS